MIKDNEMVGKTFGYWEVLQKGDNLYNRAAYICRCRCGKEKLVNGMLGKKLLNNGNSNQG